MIYDADCELSGAACVIEEKRPEHYGKMEDLELRKKADPERMAQGAESDRAKNMWDKRTVPCHRVDKK